MKIRFFLFLLMAAALLAPRPIFALELLEAKYGVGDVWIDVTDKMDGFQANDDLFFGWFDGAKLAGKDPAPGVGKTCVCRYKDSDGKEKTAVLADRAFGGFASGWMASDEFRLTSAWFGDGKNYVDVTAQVKKAFDSSKKDVFRVNRGYFKIDPDPAPGKKKRLVMFFGQENERKSLVFKEWDSVDPMKILGVALPWTKDVKSPFEGIALDRAVWQWSAPMDAISSENGERPTCWLWVPPNAKRLNGVVVGQFNMTERPIMEHPAFRSALAKIGFGCIWIAPTPFGSRFDWQDPKQSAAMQSVFDNLAKASGIPGFRTIPFVGLGHSAMAAFPYELAAWKPERAVCGLSFDGSVPGVDYHYKWLGDDPATKAMLERLKGIPFLVRDGEYSGGRENRRPLVLRKHFPELAITLFSDPGSGHFGFSDETCEFLGWYVAKAWRERRNPKKRNKFKPTNASSGWHMDFWRNGEPEKFEPGPVGECKGAEGKYGEELNWVFDKEHADMQRKVQNRFGKKKVQLLGYKMNGELLPDKRDHLQIHIPFEPDRDGLSVSIEPTFLDTVTAGRAEGWSGRAVGESVEHGADPERAKLKILCGPGVVTGPGRVSVRFDRFGFTSSRRTNVIDMVLEHPGDKTFRRMELQSEMIVPRENKDGFFQRISFPELPDVKARAKSIPLNATSSSGLPVDYYVVHGPAYVQDGKLIFTPLPRCTKLPLEVKVVAYQYGTKNSPGVQTAKPIERTLRIER